MYTVSVGNRTRIIIGPIPGLVIISSSIIDTSTVGIGIYVTGRITNIDHLGCGVVDIDILNIVYR